MRTVWEIWRYLGSAIAAVLLAASQLNPNPLPAWVFALVAGLTLLSIAVAYVLDRRQRR